VCAWQTPGHNARSIRHAYWVGDPAIIKHHAALRYRVKVRSANYFVSHEPDVVGTLLIGNEKQNIGHVIIIADQEHARH